MDDSFKATGSWDRILDEIRATPAGASPADQVRHKYLAALSNLTGRDTIAYYSGWLTQPSLGNIDINDGDMQGFMSAVNGLECSRGLDLILHTPGGSPTAAESIISYLNDKFDRDIRVIVPHLAMSAGTMMACAARTIVMGRQSSLGPIDPQFSGIPAWNIVSEFEEAKADLAEHPENAQYWAIKLQQIPAAFMKTAIDAMELSANLVKTWLAGNMFAEEVERDRRTAEARIETIVEKLNSRQSSLDHGRHLDYQFCRGLGLKIDLMEDDQRFQDAILSVHHAETVTLGLSPIVKIIENHLGSSFIMSAG